MQAIRNDMLISKLVSYKIVFHFKFTSCLMKLFICQLVSFLILPCKKFHPGCVRAWLGCCQHLRMSNYHFFFKIARSTHHCVQTLHQASAHKVRPVGWPAFNPFFNLVCSMLYFIMLYYVIF